ncbi:MAG: hypothetical protein ACI36X_01860 [Bacteroidaceae bacterium]
MAANIAEAEADLAKEEKRKPAIGASKAAYLSAKEKSAEMLEAVRFCKEHGLLREKELLLLSRGSREEKFRLACEAVMRKELWLRKHGAKETGKA